MPNRPGRAEVLASLHRTMREYMARTVLFHHAIAQRVGLHPTDVQCAHLLLLYGPTTTGDLARLTGLTRGGAITAAIDRLERAGFVRRANDPADRRRVVIHPNEERLGRVLGPLHAPIGQRWQEWLDTLDDDRLAFIQDLLTRWASMTWEETVKLRQVQDLQPPRGAPDAEATAPRHAAAAPGSQPEGGPVTEEPLRDRIHAADESSDSGNGE